MMTTTTMMTVTTTRTVTSASAATVTGTRSRTAAAAAVTATIGTGATPTIRTSGSRNTMMWCTAAAVTTSAWTTWQERWTSYQHKVTAPLPGAVTRLPEGGVMKPSIEVKQGRVVVDYVACIINRWNAKIFYADL